MIEIHGERAQTIGLSKAQGQVAVGPLILKYDDATLDRNRIMRPDADVRVSGAASALFILDMTIALRSCNTGSFGFKFRVPLDSLLLTWRPRVKFVREVSELGLKGP